MYHAVATVENLNNKQEVLSALSNFSDEDFNGGNGKEYLWEFAQGYESNQEYVLNTLEKSELIGEELINKYFELWLENDGYYKNYDVIVTSFQDNKATISVVYNID